MTKRGVHDMGGDPAGPVDLHAHEPSLTERRIDAMMQLLRAKPRGFWTTDENRRTIESLTPEFYLASGYYEKWAHAMRGLLIEKGVLTEAEVAARLTAVKARHGKAIDKPASKSGGASAHETTASTAGKAALAGTAAAKTKPAATARSAPKATTKPATKSGAKLSAQPKAKS
jgi:hypothetical protein